MLHLNVVLEMVQQLGSTILTEPQHILSFIAHALEPPPEKPRRERVTSRSITSHPNLRITDVDSDDEDEGTEEAIDDDVGDGMIFTSVNLLLSILEGLCFQKLLLAAFASHLD